MNAETAEHAKTARATAAGVAGRSAMAATASQSQTFDRGRLCCGAVGAIAARERAGRTLGLFRVLRVFVVKLFVSANSAISALPYGASVG